MRILVFSEVFYPENFLVNDLVREWVRMGHSVEVVTQYPSYPESYVFAGYENKGYRCEDWEGVKIHRYPFVEGYRDSKIRKIRNYASYVMGGKRVVDALEGDFDCAFVSQTGPLTVAYPALYLKQKRGVPVNIWTFDLWPDTVWGYGVPKNAVTEALLGRMIRSIYSRCDQIFVSSRQFATTIGQNTDNPCLYAPNWLVPAAQEKSPLRLTDGVFHFTFTGNVSRYQNLVNVVLGFARARLDNAQLNIVGDGSYLAEVKEAAARSGAKNVVFHGRRPYVEMNDILRQSDVLVLPLLSEEGVDKTEPLKLQSYLQAGKPVFGVLRGAGQAIIEENNLGLCADPDDVDAIAEGFRRMMDFAADGGHEVAAAAARLLSTRFNRQEIIGRITQNLVKKRYL